MNKIDKIRDKFKEFAQDSMRPFNRMIKVYCMFALVLLLLINDFMIVNAGTIDAAGTLSNILSALQGIAVPLGGLLGLFGLIKIGIGVAQDSPADKQQGALACVGAAIIIGAGTFF